MKIRIAYQGQFRAAAGAPGEELELREGAGLGDALEAAAARRPALRILLFAADGTPSRSVLVAVNDRQVRPGATAALHDGDAILLMPPIGGG